MKGLYAHIPFCVRKCKYCDFVSYTDCMEKSDAYIDKLISEMKEYEGEKIDSVFIGGGTPTILSAGQLKRLVSSCFEIFDINTDYEFTIEANPGTLCDEKIRTLKECGVNRISVGVQSFDNDELKIIGRIHDSQTAYNTVCRLSELGFSNINLDIMTALPFQNKKTLLNTLKTAVSLPVTHISAYSLILEPQTALTKEYERGLIDIPDDESDREMYAMTKEFLSDNGFKRYEISNFAKEGFECRHNIKYWECREYIGVGVAASSFIGEARFTNTASMEEYLGGKQVSKEVLTKNDKISEFMMLGLRMDRGISAAEFKKRFGVDISSVYGSELSKFIKMGLIVEEANSYRFSERGIDVSNSVLCEFMLNC